VLFGTATLASSKEKERWASRLARAEFEGALRSNTAFANLLARQATRRDEKVLVGDKDFHTVLSGAREFTIEHARWIFGGCRSNTYSIRDVILPADMYLRSEVSTDEEMKVSNIGRIWVRNGKEVITETRADVGLWEVSTDMRQWAETIGLQLKERRDTQGLKTLDRSQVETVFFSNRQNVADDPLIIGRAREASMRMTRNDSMAILTQDRELCKVAANRTGMTVYRVSPDLMLGMFPAQSLQQDILDLDNKPEKVREKIKFPKEVKLFYVDTGSLQFALMQHDSINSKSPDVYRREVLSYGTDHVGRWEDVSYKKVEKRIWLTFDKRTKDSTGRPGCESFLPQKRIKSKLPKFESYRDSGSERTGSSRSRGSGIGLNRPFLPSEND
jgi:hypothetical protein